MSEMIPKSEETEAVAEGTSIQSLSGLIAKAITNFSIGVSLLEEARRLSEKEEAAKNLPSESSFQEALRDEIVDTIPSRLDLADPNPR
jgi:hypothetical protein